MEVERCGECGHAGVDKLGEFGQLLGESNHSMNTIKSNKIIDRIFLEYLSYSSDTVNNRPVNIYPHLFL